ncbi:MAG: hypothetical protein HFH23_16635 [Ruminococcus sp.]|nr:hypothetical protein [Ruminococcus sp.]
MSKMEIATKLNYNRNGIQPSKIASGNGPDACRHHHFIGRRPCGEAHSPMNSNQ